MRRRPLLRAAAVGGGAYAFGKHRERKQEEQQAYAPGPQTATAAPASGGITAEDTQRLEELGRLHEQGILTDEEFSAQKRRILGMA